LETIFVFDHQFDPSDPCMNRLFPLSAFILLLTLGCAKKDQESYLWALALLGSQSSGFTNTTPENPNSDPTGSIPIKIHITILPAPSTQNLCPNYGGVFIQYKKGDETSCSANNWDLTCVSFLYNPDGSTKMLDSRSFIGINWNDDVELPSNFLPSQFISNLVCFKQQIPPNKDHVEMYSFQLQSIKSNNVVCESTWNENQCVDTIPILGRAEFIFPKEFPILSSDGDGHAGSQTLLLKFITEDSLYTTCTYFGNEHRKLNGFTENAYIAGNGNQDGGLGSCRQCDSDYCESIDPNTGTLISLTPKNEFKIPIGTLVTVQKEIIMVVVKGQGPGKHSVRWNLQGFNQWIVTNQLPVFLSNSNVLFVFMFPILLTTFLVILKLRKKRIQTRKE
jgi:hypothetical protein